MAFDLHAIPIAGGLAARAMYTGVTVLHDVKAIAQTE